MQTNNPAVLKLEQAEVKGEPAPFSDLSTPPTPTNASEAVIATTTAPSEVEGTNERSQVSPGSLELQLPGTDVASATVAESGPQSPVNSTVSPDQVAAVAEDANANATTQVATGSLDSTSDAVQTPLTLLTSGQVSTDSSDQQSPAADSSSPTVAGNDQAPAGAPGGQSTGTEQSPPTAEGNGQQPIPSADTTSPVSNGTQVENPAPISGSVSLARLDAAGNTDADTPSTVTSPVLAAEATAVNGDNSTATVSQVDSSTDSATPVASGTTLAGPVAG